MTDLSNVTIDGERQTWQQLYERERVKVLDLEGYRIMLSDLDRNENGRHEGDGDGYDPATDTTKVRTRKLEIADSRLRFVGGSE